MRAINRIIIHCAATKPSMDIGLAEITKWHTDAPPKGNGWRAVGYHWIIRRSGEIERGRSESVAGAHVAGHNADSIGICVVGGIDDAGKPDANFTRHQWAALESLVRQLVAQYPDAQVSGHRDWSSKACPSFNARAWWASNG